MFVPNTTGYLSLRSGWTAQGEPEFEIHRQLVACGVVILIGRTVKTTVRADSSASRGSAEEDVNVAKILFPAYVTIRKGDRFEVSDETLRVTGVQPRRAVTGVLDHYEVELERWPGS